MPAGASDGAGTLALAASWPVTAALPRAVLVSIEVGTDAAGTSLGLCAGPHLGSQPAFPGAPDRPQSGDETVGCRKVFGHHGDAEEVCRLSQLDPAPAGNLPVDLTSFVGRRRELDEVKSLVSQSRLVTLTGVGGSGKTRLAVRAAAELRQSFADGVWFVDLTAGGEKAQVLPARDADMTASLVLMSLRLRELPGGGGSADQLVRHLADRSALLVLDTCEHVLTACASLVDALLQGCVRLHVLATSREPLTLTVETIFAVPPLPVPPSGERTDVATVAGYGAVKLLVTRAQAVVPDFSLTPENQAAVAELCRRLDGLPLAIELAAARMRALAPAQVLQRLSDRFALLSRGDRDAPHRQQTLRACLDWSFELCTERERLLWARLSVFVGGFDLNAAAEVCSDETLPAGSVTDVVTGLAGKSILVHEQSAGFGRYRMLDTLRDYALEKLTQLREQGSMRRRHRDWFLSLVDEAAVDAISSRQAQWLERLDRELPNIRHALENGLAETDRAETRTSEVMLAAVTGLHMYWVVRGLYTEGRYWMDHVLARSAGPTMTLVKALNSGAALASLQTDLPAAVDLARRGQEIADQLGDSHAHAIAAAAEGAVVMASGDVAGAARLWRRSADELAEDEYLFWRVSSLVGIAMAEGMLGDVDGARSRHETVLAICEPREESFFCGLSLCHLGIGLWKHGDLDAAAARLREALSSLRRVNDTLGTMWCLDALAWIAHDQGQSQRAATLLGAATRLARTTGTPPAIYPELSAYHRQYEQQTDAAIGSSAYQAALLHGQSLSLDEAIRYALGEPYPPAAESPTVIGPEHGLTHREYQIAELVANGLPNKQIAVSLVISPRTVEKHVHSLLSKLGLRSRAQVAAWFVTHARDVGHDS